ncbi:hypothetical protein [Mesoterricola silvestris]|uniref:Uncharacterized protein n=1 Tax=Mesoterricola silvestris TaxID=2927979 RepID=A0AA48K9A3_9BACT|nr:hypothetical protein [Mesoterricola silvestris]BDU72905.1 hypothetical protein METEAL_20790 [Mesoterricola silvestris]
MSTWHVTAVERLGAPSPQWPTIYGPASGSDPISANGLHTLDLTPFLVPMEDLTSQMERDLASSGFSSISLDLEDATGVLADMLGPESETMAAPGRYFGPWIQVWEHWGESNAELRFLGVMDESSIQWSEEDAETQATVIHASELLRERLITDFPEMLRPWPSVPTNSSQDWVQSTADALLESAAPDFTPRGTAATIEAGLWALGQLSWIASINHVQVQRAVFHVDQDPTLSTWSTNYSVPAPPASSVIIDGTAYAVDHLEWDTSIGGSVVEGDPATNFTESSYRPVRIILQGAPDLTGHLHLGDTVVWGIPESQRTHYLLTQGITSPASGSDGQRYVDLNTVEQLAVGDVLTLTFLDTSNSTPRKVTADLPAIIDLDGEIGRAWLAKPLNQGYAGVSKVRRNSQDPVLFDGLAFARALAAPFAVDATAFAPAPTDVPVLAFRPYDVASPSMYGVHCLQTIDLQGTLMAARRGSDNGSGSYTVAGIWTGSWASGWAWKGLPQADATHRIYGDVLQWPGSANSYAAPVIYTEGDLSGSAATPPNGWRQAWRSWKSLEHITQDPESTWNGTDVIWDTHTSSGDIPARVVHFSASTPTPGRYERTSEGTWTFQAHTADATLGGSSTPTVTGTYPAGNTLALGMGIRSNGDEEEALLALVVTGAAYPFSAVSACLLSQASGGALTVRQTAALWSTGSIPAGPWALGGGLVVQTWKQTIGGLDYPHTVLHKLNGTTVITSDLKTMEVIPQTIQPLMLRGDAGSRIIGGWYALAIETFMDEDYAAARRLRFLHLDSDLQVINGEPESDPSTPTDNGTNFSRGELIASILPDGAIIAKMVRTSATADEMAGIVGGRLFSIGNTLPTTVERLKLGASDPKGNTLSVAYSGDGMSVGDYMAKFAAAQLASAIASPDGSLSLVSQSAGPIRLRTLGSQQVSVQASERGEKSKSQVWQGYLRKVRITYNDILAKGSASVEIYGSYEGGKILEMDVSDLVCGPTMGVAIGRAIMTQYGRPLSILQETWVDRTAGASGDLAPTWWSTWRVGDRVVMDPFTAPATVNAYKILTLKPGLEDRSVKVELRKQPFPIRVEA